MEFSHHGTMPPSEGHGFSRGHGPDIAYKHPVNSWAREKDANSLSISSGLESNRNERRGPGEEERTGEALAVDTLALAQGRKPGDLVGGGGPGEGLLH